MNHKYPNPKKNGKYLFLQWIRSHPQEHPTHITLLESLCRRHMQEINQEIGPTRRHPALEEWFLAGWSTTQLRNMKSNDKRIILWLKTDVAHKYRIQYDQR